MDAEVNTDAAISELHLADFRRNRRWRNSLTLIIWIIYGCWLGVVLGYKLPQWFIFLGLFVGWCGFFLVNWRFPAKPPEPEKVVDPDDLQRAADLDDKIAAQRLGLRQLQAERAEIDVPLPRIKQSSPSGLTAKRYLTLVVLIVAALYLLFHAAGWAHHGNETTNNRSSVAIIQTGR